MMGKTCGIISGLLVLIAGLALLLFGLNVWGVGAANLVAGVMLALFGLSFMMHKMNACPMCTVPEMKAKGK
jgi:uncharacterized membrane protein